MPLSRITVASLTDMGYVTTMTGADSYSFLSAMRSMASGTGGTMSQVTAMSLGDDIANAPLYEVQRNGARRLVRPAAQ